MRILILFALLVVGCNNKGTFDLKRCSNIFGCESDGNFYTREVCETTAKQLTERSTITVWACEEIK